MAEPPVSHEVGAALALMAREYFEEAARSLDRRAAGDDPDSLERAGFNARMGVFTLPLAISSLAPPGAL